VEKRWFCFCLNNLPGLPVASLLLPGIQFPQWSKKRNFRYFWPSEPTEPRKALGRSLRKNKVPVFREVYIFLLMRFTCFNLAPTNGDYAIHNLPVHVLLAAAVDLLITMTDAIGYATGSTINAACFHKPDTADRTKATTSVEILFTPARALLLKDSIRH